MLVLIRGQIWRRLVGATLRLYPGVDVEGAVYARTPVRVRRAQRGRVVIGRGAHFRRGVLLELFAPDAEISIGKDVLLNDNVRLMAASRIQIGEGTFVAWDVTVMDSNLHSLDGSRTPRPVAIGSHVWIGAGAYVLPGVRIGDGAVVAARAVVTHDVPPGALVAGNPARVVRTAIRWEP